MGLRVAAPQKVRIDVVEKLLEESRCAARTGANPVRQTELRSLVWRHRLLRVEELIEDPSLKPLAAIDIPVRSAGRLTVVGKDIEIVLVLGYASHHAPELADRAVHAT
jgi:hypothetical protein